MAVMAFGALRRARKRRNLAPKWASRFAHAAACFALTGSITHWWQIYMPSAPLENQVNLTGTSGFDGHDCRTPLTKPEVFHGICLVANDGYDIIVGKRGFPPASAKSTLYKRPCPRYWKVAEQRGLRHFDNIETSCTPQFGTTLAVGLNPVLQTKNMWRRSSSELLSVAP